MILTPYVNIQILTRTVLVMDRSGRSSGPSRQILVLSTISLVEPGHSIGRVRDLACSQLSSRAQHLTDAYALTRHIFEPICVHDLLPHVDIIRGVYQRSGRVSSQDPGPNPPLPSIPDSLISLIAGELSVNTDSISWHSFDPAGIDAGWSGVRDDTLILPQAPDDTGSRLTSISREYVQFLAQSCRDLRNTQVPPLMCEVATRAVSSADGALSPIFLPSPLYQILAIWATRVLSNFTRQGSSSLDGRYAYLRDRGIHSNPESGGEYVGNGGATTSATNTTANMASNDVIRCSNITSYCSTPGSLGNVSFMDGLQWNPVLNIQPPNWDSTHQRIIPLRVTLAPDLVVPEDVQVLRESFTDALSLMVDQARASLPSLKYSEILAALVLALSDDRIQGLPSGNT